MPVSVKATSAGDRHQERTFKQWLNQCHTELDKSITFEQLADEEVQVQLLTDPCAVQQCLSV